MSTFFSNISAPVLTDLDLDFGNLITYDIYPHPLPDLFMGSQIAVVGRYRQGGKTDVTLSGTSEGQRQQFKFVDREFSEKSANLKGSTGSLPGLWATRKIGYLLQQVRLNGPQPEIIDEIVKLSIRYGIVTPYTSYLVTEPLPLGIEEQDRIAGEEFNRFSDQATLPTFGQQAVEEAEGQNSLASADAAAPAPVEMQGKVHTIGTRTFIQSDGIWIDTMYDPEKMETIEIEFLSEDYFSIAEERPGIADAFALGPRVIFVSGDEVLEVVEGPMTENRVNSDTNLPILNPEQTTPTSDQPDSGESDPSFISPSESSNPPCLSGLFVSLITISVMVVVKKINMAE